MSNSSLVCYTQISPHKNSPRNHKIDTVAIHCVVGQCSVETLGSIFQNKQASSNYGIGPDGRIGQYVDEGDRSWCTSSSAVDNRAVTIEVASDTTHPYAVTDKAYQSLITLLADICKRNGIKKLLWKADKSLMGQVDKQNMVVHRWTSTKSCPGDYLYNRHGEIAEKVNALLDSGNVVSTVANTVAQTVASTVSSVASTVQSYSSVSVGTCNVSLRVLQKGMSGNDCTALMAILKDLGYYKLGVDNQFGSGCDNAVKEYQKAKKLTVDGVVGKQTWGSLCVGLRRLSKGMSGTDCHVLMVLLKQFGYYKYSCDTVFGAKCEEAVRAFQKAKNITVDGIVGQETWSKLLAM